MRYEGIQPRAILRAAGSAPCSPWQRRREAAVDLSRQPPPPLSRHRPVSPTVATSFLVPQNYYRDVQNPGDGENFPKPGDRVSAHYIGTLLSDGSKFDSSRDRGTPFNFTIGKGQVIKCWDAAIAEMSVGERSLITCSAAYAYGDRGAGAKIPGGADLVFDVELLAINP